MKSWRVSPFGRNDREESVWIFSLCVANSNALLANAFKYLLT